MLSSSSEGVTGAMEATVGVTGAKGAAAVAEEGNLACSFGCTHIS
jgi:hypothetical protein